MEIGEELLIGNGGEGFGHVVLEEGDDAGNLFHGDFGVDARGILQVGAGGIEDRGNRVLAGDYGFQTIGGRGEIAGHDGENASADPTGIDVRIALPRLHLFKIEKLGADEGEQDVAVGRGAQGVELLFEDAECFDAGVDAGAGVVFKLGIVFVNAGLGGSGGKRFEVEVVKELIGELGERLGLHLEGQDEQEGRCGTHTCIMRRATLKGPSSID